MRGHCRRRRRRRRTRTKVVYIPVEAGSKRNKRCDTKAYKRKRGLLRRRLRVLQNNAATCADTDVNCVDAAYQKVAALKARIARFRRHFRAKCPGRVRRIRTRNHVSCRIHPFNKWIKLQHAKRQAAQDGAAKCHNEDQLCVRRFMARVLKINKSIRHNKRRCGRRTSVEQVNKILGLHKKKCPPQRKCPAWVHRSLWRHAVTCSGMKSKFDRWVDYMKCRRQRYHDASCHCSPDNVACLRASYMNILRMQRKIRDARTEFAQQMSTCDRCAPIKLRFRRWLHKQRRNRHRLHLEACKCEPLDVHCLQDHVDEIKAIQKRIIKRRKQVQSLHADCTVKTDYVDTTTDPYTTDTPEPVSLSPADSLEKIVGDRVDAHIHLEDVKDMAGHNAADRLADMMAGRTSTTSSRHWDNLRGIHDPHTVGPSDVDKMKLEMGIVETESSHHSLNSAKRLQKEMGEQVKTHEGSIGGDNASDELKKAMDQERSSTQEKIEQEAPPDGLTEVKIDGEDLENSGVAPHILHAIKGTRKTEKLEKAATDRFAPDGHIRIWKPQPHPQLAKQVKQDDN